MNRRDFCRFVSAAGGAIILGPIISACGPRSASSPVENATQSPVAPTPSPPSGMVPDAGAQPATSVTVIEPTADATTQPTSMPADTSLTQAAPALSQIALVRDDDRVRGVARALDMLEPDSLQGQDVLLKPNFNSADPSPGSTHPDTLRALLTRLTEMGAGQLTLVDRSGMGNTRQVMEQIGIFALIGDYHCQAIVLDELADEEWVLFHQEGLHWQDGFPIPRLLADAGIIVQTCNLKTHRYGGHFTMSLKNSVGFVAMTLQLGGHNYMTELHNSRHQRQMIAEINLAYEPDLIVMDGIEAFVSGGPANGERVNSGVILAGRDRVAMDAAGVAILRMFGTTSQVSRGRVFEQEQIARAAELGLGVTGPEQIEFITADAQCAEFAQQIHDILVA